MIQAFGIGCTLLLLIALAIAVYKGVPILVASPICGALCLLCNGMPVMEGMKEAYIGEAAGFFKTWFLFFLAGAMIVAFAGAFKSTPNFQLVVDALLDLPFPPLVSAAIAVNVLCGITASAGGGLQVALPVIAQPYLDLGVNAVALHRVTAISCGVLGSMPHSAWLNATLEATQLTQKETYKMFATICIGIAALTTVLAIVLFSVFPVLCNF